MHQAAKIDDSMYIKYSLPDLILPVCIIDPFRHPDFLSHAGHAVIIPASVVDEA